MTHYLIEFRFFGKAKGEIKHLIWEVDRNCRIGHARRHHPVPHITLVGPFGCRNEGKLISDFTRICKTFNLMDFTVEGYGTFEGSNVVFVNITPSKELDDFRWQMSKTLQEYCNVKTYDLNKSFEYHATIAMRLSSYQFKKVKSYIDNKPKPNYQHKLLRVTLIKNSIILKEYDFVLNRLLNRREAKSRRILTQTFNGLERVFKQNKESNYIPENTEKTESVYHINLDKYLDENEFSFFEKLKLKIFRRKRKIFVTSDHHFDHDNIIRFCNRPFHNVRQMNRALLNNWNNLVGKNDIVLYLGDIRYGRSSRSTDYWINKVNGELIFVKGNHDNDDMEHPHHNKVIIHYQGFKILLVHSPEDIPSDWNGWTLHGHYHNNKPEYGFINKRLKTINVSVELTEYKPVELDMIIYNIQNL